MKQFLSLLVLVLIFGFIYLYNEDIADYILTTFVYKKEIVTTPPNDYENKYEFEFVKNTDDFILHNKNELNDIFYTILNRGWEHFTFYCDNDYPTCEEDVEKKVESSNIFSDINNFVNPYNSFKEISITTNGYGTIEVTINKLYNSNDIDLLNKKIDEIYNDIIKEDMDTITKIKIIHDYIIMHASYDTKAAEDIENNRFNYTTTANKATGALIDGKAICSGYTDAMSLFLHKMNIPNIKVPGDKHIWNLVYIDNKWKHLDLTWDMATLNNEKVVLDEFFLIDYQTLLNKNKTRHTFDTNIYIEAM